MTTLFCPKCAVPQPMNVSSLRREQTDPDGEVRKVVSTSYHCAICFSFVRSEDRVDDQTEDTKKSAGQPA
jgi:hypothetical protein